MKKVLSVLMAVLFAVSCFSMMAFADNNSTGDTTINNETINNIQLVEYCKYCGQKVAFTDIEQHETNCPYKIAEASNKCYWCGVTLANEQAYNQHMAAYNACENHEKQCCYSGENYVDGGCTATFKTVEAYENHIATCSHKGDYSQKGYLNNLKDVFVAFIKGIFTDADWSGVLAGLKSLFAGFDTGALKEIFTSIIGAAGIEFSL